MNIKLWGNSNWKDEVEAEEAFNSYFERHYKPLLNKIADGNTITQDEVVLLGFLRDDLTKIFEG